MTPDFVNGAFGFCGALFILLGHCRRLYRDKKVRGASWGAVAFFFSWGLWNLFYYPHLDQWWSFAGGCAIVASNCLWLAMMVFYIAAEKRRLLEVSPSPTKRWWS